MCDLTHLVISLVLVDISTPTQAELFMSDIVLTVGMYSVLVVGNGSSFKGTFIKMCTVLKIHYWYLSRGNHKGNSVESYFHFLDKTQAIATPAGTMLRRWFLVRLYLEVISLLEQNYQTSGKYYAYFLDKHKDNMKLINKNSRW